MRSDKKNDETYEPDQEYVATSLELADALEATMGAGCATGRFDRAEKSFTRVLRKALTNKTRNLNELQRRRAGEEKKATAAEVIASAARA